GFVGDLRGYVRERIRARQSADTSGLAVVDDGAAGVGAVAGTALSERTSQAAPSRYQRGVRAIPRHRSTDGCVPRGVNALDERRLPARQTTGCKRARRSTWSAFVAFDCRAWWPCV